MSPLYATLLILLLIVCWALNLLSLPGNWLILLITVLFAALVPHDWRIDVHAWVLVALLVLAVLGEIVEFLASARGVQKKGGSRRAAVLALIGSMAGAVFGAIVGLPLPYVGSMIGALLFAGIGALAGALLGEQWAGRDWGPSFKVGVAAFWSRMLGTVAKLTIGAVMIGIVIAALVVH